MVSSRSKKRERSRSPGREKSRKHHSLEKNERKRKKEVDTEEKKEKSERSPPRKGRRSVSASEESNSDGEAAGGGGEIVLSIADTNKLREKLGLAPLAEDTGPTVKESETGDPREKIITEEGNEFVHRMPENWADKKKSENLREKIQSQKDKRRIQSKMSQVKSLGEKDDDDDSATAWVDKMRNKEKEKEMADKRAKLLEEMDEEFGVAGLIEEEIVRKKKKQKRLTSSTTKALAAGLTVEHSREDFLEGEDTVLVLKDKGVLDEGDEEVLINPTISLHSKWKKNAQLRKKKPGYVPYEEEVDEFGNFKEKVLLGKYDEELEGEKKDTFRLDETGGADVDKERMLAEIKAKLKNQNKESLMTDKYHVASEYYTPEEMTKFKKPKKRVKKIRKRDFKADDLVTATTAPNEDYGSRSRGKGKKKAEYEKLAQEDSSDDEKTNDKQWIKFEDDKMEMDDDDDLSNIIVDDDAEDELQFVLDRARKLTQQQNTVQSEAQKVVDLVQYLPTTIKAEPEEEEEVGDTIILDATSEYCRGLGEIPTYGMAGNRDDAIDMEQLAEKEKNEKKDKKKSRSKKRQRHEDLPDDEFEMLMREQEESKGQWIEADVNDTNSESNHNSDKSDSDSDEDQGNPLGNEVDATKGIGGALKLALQKGYLHNEKDRKPNGPSMKHMEAQRYSVVDKQFSDIDDKYAKKLEWMGARGGPARPFEEKTGYDPEISINYCDQHGRHMDVKEAFRFQSWKFHGKVPGKRKTEKRAKKVRELELMKKMNSYDTPLGTLEKQVNKHKQLQLPYILLSGSASKDMGTSIKKD